LGSSGRANKSSRRNLNNAAKENREILPYFWNESSKEKGPKLFQSRKNYKSDRLVSRATKRTDLNLKNHQTLRAATWIIMIKFDISEQFEPLFIDRILDMCFEYKWDHSSRQRAQASCWGFARFTLAKRITGNPVVVRQKGGHRSDVLDKN
jgi:hypothetical protein